MTRVIHMVGLAGVALAVLISCALPEGEDQSPEGAYYQWVQARQAGDVDSCWKATHSELRALLTRWHEAEREALFIVETIYPPDRRAESLEVLEEGGRARLPDAKALFTHLLSRGPGEALAGLQLLGARVSSTVLEEDIATLETMGGNRVTVRRDGDRWAVALSVEEHKAFVALVEKAEANQARAQGNVKRLRGVD